MKESNTSFTEANAAKILELAARYYAAENQGYTAIELIDAGLEVQIPHRLTRKAIEDLKIHEQQQQEQHKKKKHRLKAILGFGSIATSAIACWSIVTYNHLVAVTAGVETARQQVVNQEHRRAELIPQLVDLTNTYASHEREIVNQLTMGRQEYLRADDVAAKSQAIAKIDRAVSDFSQYATTNPQLNSNQLFINLQYEITGTANRLAVERRRYNQAVQDYNREIQQVPQLAIAKMFEFKSINLL